MKTMQLSLGQLNPRESKKILLDVISTNINYYKLKNLRSQVNREKPDTLSEKKIEELTEAGKNIIAVIQRADERNTKLKIELNITIGPEDMGSTTVETPSLGLNGIKE